MRKIIGILVAFFAFVGFVTLGYFLWDRATQISAAELKQIVQRDGLPFKGDLIPEEVLDHLDKHRVVVIGEHHFLREHRDLVAEMLVELHARGFRQFLFEWTQAADWLLADYVNDGSLEPDWVPPHDIGRTTLSAVRDFNSQLPEEDRIQVYGLDVHLADYGGTESWLYILELLSQHLPEPGPLAPFLQGDHDSFERHKVLLEDLNAELEEDHNELIATWGEYWFNTVFEMVNFELASVTVRALRESNYDESVRLREEAIKQLVDRRVQSIPQGTVINIGSTHAQKKRLWGSDIEWLGDYLVHRSEVVEGSAMTLYVAAAHIVPVPGSGASSQDLSASPENELFRVMNDTWPDQIVFLPVDDLTFSSARVPINPGGEIYVGVPKQHYDSYVLIPLAHRDFVGD